MSKKNKTEEIKFKNTKEGMITQLAFWLIFIVGLMLYLKFTEKPHNIEKNNSAIKQDIQESINLLEEINNKLKLYNYNFEYVVNSEENVVRYNGTFYENRKIIIVETENSMHKYFEQDGIMYEVKFGELRPTNATEYGENELLEIPKLIEYINSKEYEEMGSKLQYNSESESLIIENESETITINITTTESKDYSIKFTNIGKITDINYN